MTAAWLCCDIEPPESTEIIDLPDNVKKMLAFIYKHYHSNTCYGMSDDEIIKFFNPNQMSMFYRSLLREFAEETGQRKYMPFLFPEDRPKQNSNNETLYEVIRALATALSEAYPKELKKNNGKPFLGYVKDTGNRGIVGHLVDGEFTRLQRSALEEHIGRALKGD
jgi:hypothetical protein